VISAVVTAAELDAAAGERGAAEREWRAAAAVATHGELVTAAELDLAYDPEAARVGVMVLPRVARTARLAPRPSTMASGGAAGTAAEFVTGGRSWAGGFRKGPRVTARKCTVDRAPGVRRRCDAALSGGSIVPGRTPGLLG